MFYTHVVMEVKGNGFVCVPSYLVSLLNSFLRALESLPFEVQDSCLAFKVTSDVGLLSISNVIFHPPSFMLILHLYYQMLDSPCRYHTIAHLHVFAHDLSPSWNGPA